MSSYVSTICYICTMFSSYLNVLFTLVRSQNFVWFISVVCAGWEPEVLGTGNISSLWKIFWNCIVYSLGVDGRLELYFFSLNLKCLSLLPFSNGWRVLVWETETKCFEEKQICLDTLLKIIFTFSMYICILFEKHIVVFIKTIPDH